MQHQTNPVPANFPYAKSKKCSPQQALLRMLVSLVLACGLLPVMPATAQASPAAVANETAETAATVSDELLITYEDEALDLDASATGVAEQEEVVSADDSVEGTVTLAQVQQGTSVDEAIEALEATDGVAAVQPNYEYSLLTTSVSDIYATTDAAADQNQYYLANTKTVDAWDYSKAEGGVTVATIDTGANLQHEDLQGTVDAAHAYDITTNTLLANAGVANNGDANGHGTLVAGVLAAQANNGTGIAGASYNASVLPVKVFDENNKCTSADLVAAYGYLNGLIQSGEVSNLKVINISLGYYAQSENEADVALHTAIADMLNNNGVLTVCAGGNGDASGNAKSDTCYPSDFDECISVAATTASGALATYSDLNSAKDIAAPGEAILSTTAAGGYAAATGTSMAAPQVAAALALEYAADSSLSASGARTSLEETVVDIDGENIGQLNAQAAVAGVLGEDIDGESVDSAADDSTLDIDGATMVDGFEYEIDDSADSGSEELAESEAANSWRYKDGKKLNVSEEATSQDIDPDDREINTLANGIVTWNKNNGTTSMNLESGTKVNVSGVKEVGIDVSSWQGKIDWAKVKLDGITFAIFRCGSYSSSKGYHVIDPQFINNVKGAQKYGIKIGVYLYSYAENVAGSKSSAEEAQNCLSFLKQAGLTGSNMSLPVFYDLEADSQKNYGATKLASMAKQFCNTVSNAGYKVGIYANQNWWSNYLTDSAFKNSSWTRWVARYYTGASGVQKGTQVSNTSIWQFSDCGKVNGISGDVDMDFSYGSIASKGQPGYARTIADGVYTITNVNSGKVLDVTNQSTANAARLQIYANGNTNNQKFIFKYDSTTGSYTITNVNSGKVMDAANGETANGTAIQQYAGNGSGAQKWLVEEVDGEYVIHSYLDSGMVWDVKSGSTANGAKLQLYASNGTDAQKFTMSAVPSTVADGVYTVLSKLDSSKTLDVAGASKDNSARIQIYASNNTPAQRFRFTYDKTTGCYVVTNVNSGKVLDSQGGKAVNGTVVQQYASNNSMAQRWLVEKDGDSVLLRSVVDPTKVLDLVSGKGANGTKVQLYSSNGTAAQRFVMKTPSRDISDGTYVVSSKLKSSQVFDVAAGSTANAASIQLYASNGTAAQKFKFAYDSATGYYVITNVRSGKVLDAKGGKTSNGTAIQQYADNGTMAQRWIVEKDGDSVLIRSVLNTDKVFDAAGGKSSNGTKIQLYSSNGSNAQRWKLANA